MKKFYEVTVRKYTDTCNGCGRINENIAFTTTKALAEKIAKEYRENHEVNQYWMTYHLDDNNHIIIDITEHEMITE